MQSVPNAPGNAGGAGQRPDVRVSQLPRSSGLELPGAHPPTEVSLLRDDGQPTAVPQARSGRLLVYGTNSDHGRAVRGRIFPGAREATAHFSSAHRSMRRIARDELCPDERRINRLAGARRATAECRRYAAHNGLVGLVVLTFADAVDRDSAWAMWEQFSRRVRRSFGRFPWIVSGEDHVRHGLHLNWLLPPGQHHDLTAMWPHGIVSQPRTGIMSWLSSAEQARALVRYVTKDWEVASSSPQTPTGQHRYRCARGFMPECIEISALTLRDFHRFAVEYFGKEPSSFWSSRYVSDWSGPSTISMRWR